MNRAVKLNYLFIGVIGGMVAMWACGDDSGGSTGGGSKPAQAQEPSSCKKWSVRISRQDDYDDTAPKIDDGYEPFAATDSIQVYTRKCVED